MKRLIGFLVCVLGAGTAAARGPQGSEPVFLSLPRMAEAAERFVLAGWRIETSAAGDLDSDGGADLVLVLLADDEPPAAALPSGTWELDSGPRRMLAVAFARPEGGYRLLRHTGFLPRKRPLSGASQGWMLFEDGSIDASRGRLRIAFEYIRGHRTFTFRWEGDAFRLIGYDSVEVAGGCFQQLSINYLTGRSKWTAGWMDRDEELVRWSRSAPGAPLTLDQIGEGEEFEPEDLSTGFPLSCPERE